MAWKQAQPPFYRRLMVFVDGSNLLIEMSKWIGVEFKAEKPPSAAFQLGSVLIDKVTESDDLVKIRRYWFGSYQGNENYYDLLRSELRKRDFEPILFKKRQKKKEKGVDIALSTEMLVNAFNQNYDEGLLVAGDEDYFRLVKEVKRYGPTVTGAFFKDLGLSKKLRLSLDKFKYFDSRLDNNQLDGHKKAIEQELK